MLGPRLVDERRGMLGEQHHEDRRGQGSRCLWRECGVTEHVLHELLASAKLTDVCYGQHGKAEFLDLLNGMLRAYPHRELHVVVDNYVRAGRARDRACRPCSSQTEDGDGRDRAYVGGGGSY
jgi:hypothetical protein